MPCPCYRGNTVGSILHSATIRNLGLDIEDAKDDCSDLRFNDIVHRV